MAGERGPDSKKHLCSQGSHFVRACFNPSSSSKRPSQLQGYSKTEEPVGGWRRDQEGRLRSVQRHRRGSPRGWREPEGAVSPAAVGASDRRILGNSARPGTKGSSGCGLVCPTAQLLPREPLAQPASTHSSRQSPRPQRNGANAGGGGTLTRKKSSPTPAGAIRAH